MRNVISLIIMFALTASPAFADQETNFALFMPLGPVQNFVVNNSGPLTFTYDAYSDFGSAQDIGDINYDLVSNVAWEVTGEIDDSSGGQTSDDWDGTNWTLSVNGVVIVEGASEVVDSAPGAVNRSGALWEVLLTIPWSEPAGTTDCQIILTASTI